MRQRLPQCHAWPLLYITIDRARVEIDKESVSVKIAAQSSRLLLELLKAAKTRPLRFDTNLSTCSSAKMTTIKITDSKPYRGESLASEQPAIDSYTVRSPRDATYDDGIYNTRSRSREKPRFRGAGDANYMSGDDEDPGLGLAVDFKQKQARRPHMSQFRNLLLTCNRSSKAGCSYGWPISPLVSSTAILERAPSMYTLLPSHRHRHTETLSESCLSSSGA